MSDIEKYSDATFESIKHTNADGQEYWLARELQAVLEYTQWRRFSEVIERAKESCKNSGYSVEDHFANVGKMVAIGSGAERVVVGLGRDPAADGERLTISCCPAMPAISSFRTATRAKR